MKSKVLSIISALSFFTITQLLFFWLIPLSSENFIATYPFYTVLTIAHLSLSLYICNKYGLPSSAAPTIVGSVITAGEIATSILLCLFCNSTRTIIFVNAMIIVSYVLAMALFVSMCAKETSTNNPTVSEETIPVNIPSFQSCEVQSSINDSQSMRRMPHPSNK